MEKHLIGHNKQILISVSLGNSPARHPALSLTPLIVGKKTPPFAESNGNFSRCNALSQFLFSPKDCFA